MNANSFINSRVGGYVALGCLGAAVVWYVSKKIPSVQSAVNAVSPLNNKNVFKSAVDSIGEGATGDSSWTLGGAIYDVFHTEYDPNVKGSSEGFDWGSLSTIINPAAWAGAKVGETFSNYDWPDLNFESVNPASDKNIVYSGVNKAGAAATGDESFSLGSWLYDVFNPAPVAVNKKVDGDYKDYLFNNTDGIGASGSW